MSNQKRKEVNPVRNSSGALNPAGIILKSNPAAEQRGIISNGVNALYYPETICLDEIELKYLLLVYDKIFFLPIDNRLNPGHTSLTKRFSIRDTILTGAFKSKKDDHYAIMYCSEPTV